MVNVDDRVEDVVQGGQKFESVFVTVTIPLHTDMEGIAGTQLEGLPPGVKTTISNKYEVGILVFVM